jgi:putative membrane protein
VTDRDPRVYFAAERTLLAWVRTGVTVIGLGFVVARFGLFLRLFDPNHTDPHRSGFSGVLGVALALFGALLTAIAGVQFKLFLTELSPAELPQRRVTATLALILTFTITSAGLLLALYLLL